MFKPMLKTDHQLPAEAIHCALRLNTEGAVVKIEFGVADGWLR